jgi:heat shock protein HtpX
MAPPPAPGRASLAGRALLGLLLTIGFYGLALGIAAILLLFVYADLRWGRFVNARLDVMVAVAAFVILFSVFPRRDRFVPPGPRLSPTEHPGLFEEVAAIARATGQAMPREIYLTPDVNAGVTERGGVMGIGSRRVMIVGLPLLQALTVSQFRGVLAHEFGHFYGGDTRLGPWIYKTRGVIARTLGNLTGILAIPFHWYATLFLRITNAISRRQEFVADAMAGQTVGSHVYADALRTIYGLAPAFDGYMRNEYLPAVEHGFSPPFLEGFERFSRAPGVADAMLRFVADEAGGGRADAYDTHPSLSARLAALAAYGASDRAIDSTPAASLLGDVSAAEAALLAALVRPGQRGRLKRVSWDEIGAVAYLPQWQQIVREYAAALTGFTPATLPELVRDVTPLSAAVVGRRESTMGRQEIEAAIRAIAGAALAVALAHAGWTVDATPGIPVTLRWGREAIEPMTVAHQLAEGQLTPGAWLARCRELGIAGIDLASG